MVAKPQVKTKWTEDEANDTFRFDPPKKGQICEKE